MRVTLFAPLRTLLNLDTTLALGEAAAFCGALQTAANKVGERCTAEVRRDSTPDNNLQKFFNLDNDSVTWYAKPLVRLTPCESDRSALHAAGVAGSFLESSLTVRSMHLDVFDNTIAVAFVDLDIDLAAVHEAIMADAGVKAGDLTPAAVLETALTRYSAVIAERMQPSLVEPFVRALRAATRRLGFWRFGGRQPLSTIVRKPENWVAFDDISDRAVGDGWTWDDRASPLVWSHRVYHVDTFEPGEADHANALFRITEPEGPLVIKHGTSYLGEGARKEKYFEVSIYAQYFAVLLDTVKVSQRRLEQILSEPAENVDLSRAQAKADRIESLFVEVTAELSDLTSSLQDINAEIFDAITEAFTFSGLRESIKERLQASELKLSRVLDIRRRLQQRLVGLMLFFIGGAQLLSLVIDLYGLRTEYGEDDGVPGPMDVIVTNPIDLSLNVLTLGLLLVGLVYVVMKSDRAKR